MVDDDLIPHFTVGVDDLIDQPHVLAAAQLTDLVIGQGDRVIAHVEAVGGAAEQVHAGDDLIRRIRRRRGGGRFGGRRRGRLGRRSGRLSRRGGRGRLSRRGGRLSRRGGRGRFGRGGGGLHGDHLGGDIQIEGLHKAHIVSHDRDRRKGIHHHAGIDDVSQHGTARGRIGIRMVRMLKRDGEGVQRRMRRQLRPERLIAAPRNGSGGDRHGHIAFLPRQRDHQLRPILLCCGRKCEYRQHHRQGQEHRQEAVQTSRSSVFHGSLPPRGIAHAVHDIVYPRFIIVNRLCVHTLGGTAGIRRMRVEILPDTEVHCT